MDRGKVSKSIREREQEVLGVYSFSEPIVLGRDGKAPHMTDRENREKKRRKQVLEAQR
jgi:hypothetical protein